jgi:CheY-like chemotaxis protein
MGKLLRILHVENKERDVALLKGHLTGAGFEVVHRRVDTADAMRAALGEEEWDLILCDYSMPKSNALDALAILKDQEIGLPIIIISSIIGEEFVV